MMNRKFEPVEVNDAAMEAAVAQALDLIADGARVGLGTGRAAEAFIAALGVRARHGLLVTAVPTSAESARHARIAGVPLIELGENMKLDLIVDGADEVAPNLDLVKGWGGALVKERIVASVAARQIILVGPEKLVGALGERGRIPIEVIPLAHGPVMGWLRARSFGVNVRTDAEGSRPQLTENGNFTLDCAIAPPFLDARAARLFEADVLSLAGVVDTGLFLGTAPRVLVGFPDGRVVTLHPTEIADASY